jgi:excinuclease ABC subunit C
MSTSQDQRRQKIEAQLEAAPRTPGVYLMKGAGGEVLYIGKAKELRSRTRSYFRVLSDTRVQVEHLVDRVHELEFLVTQSEKDALLLENNLIKRLKPRFNVRLRDDKSYVILKVNVGHRWPRALVTRGYREDGSTYFGPFSSADKVRSTVRALQRIFPLRLCSDHTLENRTRPCVYYDIRMCSAPCVDRIDEPAYREYVTGFIQFMKGKDRAVLDGLRSRMLAAADRRRYEEAAELRDRIAAIQLTVERQTTEETGETYDRDVFGYHWSGDELAIQALYFRNGKLTHSSAHRFRALLPVGELLGSFLVQFYDGEKQIPPEILLPVSIEDQSTVADWLSEKAGRRVQLHCPQRGDKRDQVELAGSNAAQALAAETLERERQAELLDSLQAKLGLVNHPEVIECYDISHLGGRQTVGSRVTFVDGVADKDRYRRYRVRTAGGGDDYAALDEVLSRRLQRGITAGELPDLIVIDGGKGQLGRVLEVLARLNIVDIDVIGLAKARRLRRRGRVERSDERVVKADRPEPIILKQDSPENHFLVRMRDEAHRFAIRYQRQLKRRTLVHSELEEIPGIGPRRRSALLTQLGSVAAVRAAALEDLVPVVGQRAAERVHAFFHPAPTIVEPKAGVDPAD